MVLYWLEIDFCGCYIFSKIDCVICWLIFYFSSDSRSLIFWLLIILKAHYQDSEHPKFSPFCYWWLNGLGTGLLLEIKGKGCLAIDSCTTSLNKTRHCTACSVCCARGHYCILSLSPAKFISAHQDRQVALCQESRNSIGRDFDFSLRDLQSFLNSEWRRIYACVSKAYFYQNPNRDLIKSCDWVTVVLLELGSIMLLSWLKVLGVAPLHAQLLFCTP